MMNITGDMVECEVVKIKRVDDEKGGFHGVMQEIKIPGHKAPVQYWLDDNKVTNSGYWERKRRSYIPRKYLEKESKDFKWLLYGLEYQNGTDSVKEKLNNFIIRFESFCRQGTGLYINSPVHGSGKTLLGCIVASEIMKRIYHASVKYTTVPDYLELMKGKNDQRTEKNQEYRECTLLVLDEMGSGKSDWDKDILRNLISYRMSQYKPIIYISSCPMSKLTGDGQIIALIEDMSIDIGLPPVNVRHNLAEEQKAQELNKAAQERGKEIIF